MSNVLPADNAAHIHDIDHLEPQLYDKVKNQVFSSDIGGERGSPSSKLLLCIPEMKEAT